MAQVRIAAGAAARVRELPKFSGALTSPLVLRSSGRPPLDCTLVAMTSNASAPTYLWNDFERCRTTQCSLATNEELFYIYLSYLTSSLVN